LSDRTLNAELSVLKLRVLEVLNTGRLGWFGHMDRMEVDNKVKKHEKVKLLLIDQRKHGGQFAVI